MSHIHRLAAILIAGHRRDDLGHNRTGHLKALWALNHLLVHHGPVIQHVRDIDETAVENRQNKVIRVMKMNRALFMGHGNCVPAEAYASSNPWTPLLQYNPSV